MAGFLTNGRTFYVPGELPCGLYLTVADVNTFALPTRTATDIGSSILAAACAAASAEFDEYASARWRLPLQRWGLDIVQRLAFRAAGMSLHQRGFDYATNPTIIASSDAALVWMENVRDRKVHPVVIESQPAIYVPRVLSAPLRGW